MIYNYDGMTFEGDVSEIQTELRTYLEDLPLRIKDGCFWLGLESVNIPKEASCIETLHETMIKVAVYQVAEGNNCLTYNNKKYHGSWDDVRYMLKQDLEKLDLVYCGDSHFMLGTLANFFLKRPVKSIKDRLLRDTITMCLEMYEKQNGTP